MNIEEGQDCEEGFFPQQPIIVRKPTSLNRQQGKPCNYQPRVLRQASIFKKLPLQTNEFVSCIQNIEQSDIQSANMPSNACSLNVKQQSVSAFQKYGNKTNFCLVYTKSAKCPLKDGEDNFANRQIMLHNAYPYSSQNYIQLQNFSPKTKDLEGHKEYIQFDSQFECGNLLCVYKSLIEQHSYHCFIQNDTNTFGYNQWLYFSIIGARKGFTYKFYVVNMRKKFSFFKMGMKPVFFSLKQHQETGNGWTRKGTNISYTSSSIYDTKNKAKLKLYCLYFEVQFDYDEDFITLSLGMPYSYSRLIHHLKLKKEVAIENDVFWEQKTIAYTISSNQVPYLIIYKDQGDRVVVPKIKRSKRYSNYLTDNGRQIIIILARQHSGQTHSSYLMEQILNVLSKSQCNKIKLLLERYQFRIFPMVNVDGVIYGNFRCDLAGFDLNRTWKRSLKEIHPQIFAIKRQIARLSRLNKIVGFFDLHSHSKQFNIFSYCSINNSDQILSRLYSFMLGKSTPLFWFPSCTFGISKNKQGTARAVIALAIKNIYAITIQSSCYAFKSNDKITAIQPSHFSQMAASLLTTMNSYFSGGKQRRNCKEQIAANIQEMRLNIGDNELNMSGSDSEPDAYIEDSTRRLQRLLPPKIIQMINKRLLQQQKNDFQNVQFTSKKKLQTTSLQNISGKKKQIVQKQLKDSVRLKNILTEPAQLKSSQNQQSAVQMQEMRREIKIQSRRYSIKSNRIAPLKISTHRKHNRIKQQPWVENIRTNRNQQNQRSELQFKRSMKRLYNQLQKDPNEELSRQIRQSQLVVSCKLPGDRRINYFKDMTKMQRMLKINRKTNIFKSLTKRQSHPCNDSELLQIYSHASMTEQSKNNASLYRKLKKQQNSPLKLKQGLIFQQNQGYLRGSIAMVNKLKNYHIKSLKKAFDNI